VPNYNERRRGGRINGGAVGLRDTGDVFTVEVLGRQTLADAIDLAQRWADRWQMMPRQGGQEAIRARLFFLQMPVILARWISGIISDICINNISNYTTIINHNLTSHDKIVAE
jgi:hypothetical protein